MEIRVKTITSTLNLWKSVLKYHHQHDLKGWIPLRHKTAAINRITIKVMPNNRGAAAF